MTHIAFLRGINVSGQKIIKMTKLAEMISSLKYENVRTYIQSGNVIIQSNDKDAGKHEDKIERLLRKELGYEVTVIVRDLQDIEELIKENPFKKYSGSNAVKPYVVLLKSDLKESIKLPYKSEKDGVEIIYLKNRNACCLSSEIACGKWGFPNVFIEKKFKIAATTRNWNTINKIVEIGNLLT